MKQPLNHPKVDALLKGDETTIKMLYENLLPKFRNFVYKNKGTYSDAEEVFHNSLYQLIVRAKVGGVEIRSSFEGYVFTICKNLWFKELNKRKKTVRNDGVFELKSEDDNHVESIIEQEKWDLFEAMLEKLSDVCSKLLKDYFNKVPYDKIVKKFSYASENAAFQRVFKCKKRLMNLVKADPRYKSLY